MHRDSDDLKDPIAYVILTVKDMTKTVAAIKAAGGSNDQEIRGRTGVQESSLEFLIDPVGNRIELIQQP